MQLRLWIRLVHQWSLLPKQRLQAKPTARILQVRTCSLLHACTTHRQQACRSPTQDSCNAPATSVTLTLQSTACRFVASGTTASKTAGRSDKPAGHCQRTAFGKAGGIPCRCVHILWHTHVSQPFPQVPRSDVHLFDGHRYFSEHMQFALPDLISGSSVSLPIKTDLILTGWYVLIGRKLQQKYAARPAAADTPPEDLLAMPPRLVAGTPAAGRGATLQQLKQQAVGGIGRWQQQQPGMPWSKQKPVDEPSTQQSQQRQRPTVRFAGVRSMSRSPAGEPAAQQVGCAVTAAKMQLTWLLTMYRGWLQCINENCVNLSSLDLFNARALHSQTLGAARRYMARLSLAWAAAQQRRRGCRAMQAAEHPCMQLWTWQPVLTQLLGLLVAGPHPQSCDLPSSGRRQRTKTLHWGL